MIRSRLWQVLEDPTYAARAKDFAAEMAALPSVEKAVALLERLARDREPIIGA